MAAETAVALIDSDAARRAALKSVLVAAGLRVAFDARLGIAEVAAVTEAATDTIFIAFEEPLPRAVQAVEELAVALPDAVIVAYADEATTHAYRRAIAAGAKYLIDTPVSANEMRAIIEALGPRKPALSETGTVAVVAGQKGGIGKTTISVNLASTLARESKGSVLLVDLDPDFGDAGMLLDLNTNISTARAARQQAEFEFESFKRSLALHESGAFLLGAPQSFSERLATAPEDLQALVAFASRAFDYVLIDTPCMLNETVIAALSIADVTLVTTTLEFGSLRNTNLLLREMEREGIRTERSVLVANHTDPLPSFSAGDAAEVLERKSIWEIPYDKAMPLSTQLGQPLILAQPKSAASKSLRALAGRLGADPARIDRRVAVRGESRAPQEARERLFSVVGRERASAQPVYVFSAARRSTTYHASGCKMEQRLSRRSAAPLRELPGNLKPCRVCLKAAA